MAKKRKKKKGKDIILLKWILILLLVALLSFLGYAFFYTVFADQALADENSATEVTVQITSGMSDMEAAKELKHYGLIRNQYIFFAQSKIFMDSDASIQAGTYKLSTAMDAEEILEVLTSQSDESGSDSSEGTNSSK
jgi:UPF0755 protein